MFPDSLVYNFLPNDMEELNDISLNECFQLQLSEVEMLSSMYPDSQEFNILCPFVLKDVNRFISGETKYTPNQLDFILNLKIEEIKV